MGDRRGESLTLASLAVAQFSQEPPDADGAEESARRALELADEFDVAFGGAMVGIMAGRLWLARGRVDDAVRQFETSLALANGIDDTLGQAIALSHLGWARLVGGEPERARECFGDQLLFATTIGHEEGIADALEGMFAAAATSGDIERAGRMFGAAEDIRARKGLPTRSPLSFYEPFLERVLAGPDASRFEEARGIGRKPNGRCRRGRARVRCRERAPRRVSRRARAVLRLVSARRSHATRRRVIRRGACPDAAWGLRLGELSVGLGGVVGVGVPFRGRVVALHRLLVRCAVRARVLALDRAFLGRFAVDLGVAALEAFGGRLGGRVGLAGRARLGGVIRFGHHRSLAHENPGRHPRATPQGRCYAGDGRCSPMSFDTSCRRRRRNARQAVAARRRTAGG